MNPNASATYQGFRCQAAFFENVYGFSPGHGWAIMPFKKFPTVIDGVPWDILGKASGTGDRQTGVVDGRLNVRGPLSFQFSNEDPVTLQDLYIGDGGIEDHKRSVTRLADEGLCLVPFMDVRGLWATRGDMAGSYNILRSASGLPFAPVQQKNPLKAPPTSVISPGSSAIRAGPSDPGAYKPKSLKEDGTPYTLTDLINVCLSRLPGNVKLVGNFRALELTDSIYPTGIALMGELAVRVLSDLLGAWHLRFSFDPITNTCAIWRRTDGMPAETHQGGVVTSFNFERAAGVGISLHPERVCRWTRRTQHYYPALSVRVLGQPMIFEATRELVPVGEVNGEIKPLAEAAAFYGMDMMSLRRWVLLPRDAQLAWKGGILQPEAVDELRRWAFRWFGFREEDRGFLPILPYRARSMVDGTQRAPVVMADVADECRLSQEEALVTGLTNALARRAQLALDRLEQAKNRPIPQGESSGVQTVHGFTVPSISNLFKVLFTPDKPSLEPLRKVIQDEIDAATASLAATRAAVNKAQSALADSEQDELRLINRALATISPARYHVDRDGVVKFDFIVGWLDIFRSQQNPGKVVSTSTVQSGPLAGQETSKIVDLAKSGLTMSELPTITMTALVGPPDPRVVMIFAYESKPESREVTNPTANEFDKTGDYIDHYSYLAVRNGQPDQNGDSPVTQANNLEPHGVDSAPLYTRVVRTDLRCYVDIEGGSNRPDMDTASEKIAERELQGTDQFSGPDGEVLTYYPLQPTGAVAAVSWLLDARGGKVRARTRWRTGVVHVVEERQPGRVKAAGTIGLSTEPGSVVNPVRNR